MLLYFPTIWVHYSPLMFPLTTAGLDYLAVEAYERMTSGGIHVAR